jgi:predicted transposase/invertase (TIGR01784 family)
LTDREKRAKINEIVQREEGIAMASEVLIEITRDDIEWARQLSEERRILGYQSDMVSARREGRQEGLKEAAKNLKANGISLEIIAQSTGLSPEAIAGLQSFLRGKPFLQFLT